MNDRLGDSLARARAERPLPVTGPLEADSTFAHVFICVVCGRQRPDEKRQCAGSEVCLKCVDAAGLDPEI